MKFIFSFIVICTVALSGVEYEPKDYTYLIEKMPKIDKKLQKIHFKLYQGYVANVNKLNQLLESDLDSFAFQAVKRRYGWEYDGMMLHQLYFDNLGGNGRLGKNRILYKKIVKQFGSFAKWKDDVIRTALVRGIGWVILYWDSETDELTNAWIQEHALGLLATNTPLLVIDLWEHAYLCQFGLNRKQYMDTVFSYIDWNVVSKRMQ